MAYRIDGSSNRRYDVRKLIPYIVGISIGVGIGHTVYRSFPEDVRTKLEESVKGIFSSILDLEDVNIEGAPALPRIHKPNLLPDKEPNLELRQAPLNDPIYPLYNPEEIFKDPSTRFI